MAHSDGTLRWHSDGTQMALRWHACWQRRSLGCIRELERRTLLCGAQQRPVSARGGAHRQRRLLKRRVAHT
jgi:hypothetical protein